MAKRSYNQHCALARGLDLVGERWTLLLVRELLTGPKRFKDLAAGLRGIGTNLLSARLRDLEQSDVIRQVRLPPPASTAAYELTEVGRDLEQAVVALARWGSRFLGAPVESRHRLPSGAALVLRYAFRPERANGVDETYELEVDGQVFHARVANGSIDTQLGPALGPVARIACSSETFHELGTGRLDVPAALADGRLRAEGDRTAVLRWCELFDLPDPLPAATD